MPAANAQSTSPLAILVEDDPFDSAYTLDVIAAVAPEMRVLAFDNLPDALNALAAHTAVRENLDVRTVLFLGVELLDDKPEAIAEALRRHKNMGQVHVVAILACGNLAKKQRVLQWGADDVLLKPADPAIVARTLKSVGALGLAAAA